MPDPHPLPSLCAQDLKGRYDALLLDAYGVLVNSAGALPHAKAFIDALRAWGMPFYIVTNDASRLPDTIAARFAHLGLNIAAPEIVTSASLLAPLFEREALRGQKVVVLGSDDAMSYVTQAGGQAARPGGAVHPDARAIVICDATGADTVADVECVIDTVVHRRSRDEPLELILCNPDLVYPRGPGRLGLTSGALMHLVEASLKTCLHPSRMPTLHKLGKPFGAIFAEATRRANSRNVALVGDQLGTDILGANDFGIDSILIGTGLTEVRAGLRLQIQPSFFLPDLRLA